MIAKAPVFDVELLVVSNQAGENRISSSTFYLFSKSVGGECGVDGNLSGNKAHRLHFLSLSGLCKNITWGNKNLSSTLSLGIYYNGIWNQMQRSPLNETFENVVCINATVSFRLRCAKV